MVSKVLLYDANDAKVGETFMRRARQLVNQQRAQWIDDSHSAIRFAPDVNKWEKEVVPSSTITTDSEDDSWLYTLAEKRLHERKLFFFTHHWSNSWVLQLSGCVFWTFRCLVWKFRGRCFLVLMWCMDDGLRHTRLLLC